LVCDTDRFLEREEEEKSNHDAVQLECG
jgi:hypothetical protein